MNPLKDAPSGSKEVRRRYYLEKRRVLSSDPEQKAALDMDIQSRLLLSRQFREADTVLLYISRPHEIATDMIMSGALINGKTVAAPRCGDDGVMRFYRVRGMSDLAPGRFGIPEPIEGSEPVEITAETLCVCPALSCDLGGYRLGFGGGWYDRFLKDFGGVSAALCYTDSLVPELPREEQDVPVDMIVTDSYVKEVNIMRN